MKVKWWKNNNITEQSDVGEHHEELIFSGYSQACI